MSSALAGLIGAGIGALAGVAGAFISQYMQARATKKRSLQSKKEEAYSRTLQYLLRVQNRRSGISAEHGSYIEKESVKELFDDMVEAQFWASNLTIYCSKDQSETVTQISRELNETVASFVSGELMRHYLQSRLSGDLEKIGGQSPFQKFHMWYETILACARKDIETSYAV